MTATYIRPYISAREFVKFINSLRHRKPDPLTLKALQEIGVSESNSYTLKGSLVRMGIYDEDGKLLERDDLIGLSSRDETIKRETFRRILKRTYDDVLNEIPTEEATVEKVKTFFEKNGASPAPAHKGARLFIWLAGEAGFETAEVEFVPYSLEQEKKPTQKPKQAKKELNKTDDTNGSRKRNRETLYTPRTADEAEDWLLHSILEKIDSTEGPQLVDLIDRAQKLIDSKRERVKSHHTSKTTELSLQRKENEDV